MLRNNSLQRNTFLCVCYFKFQILLKVLGWVQHMFLLVLKGVIFRHQKFLSPNILVCTRCEFYDVTVITAMHGFAL